MPRKYVKKGTRSGEVDEDAMESAMKKGKSRIYTDTPEKQRLEELETAKDLKKQEQERKQRAKEIKRALLIETKKTSKPKRQKKTIETDSEDETDISLRESSCSPIEEMSDDDDETPVLTENIKEETFVLMKFEQKKTVSHYVGLVVEKYSPIEYKVSFLRKKPGTWKFVFPNTKDEGNVYVADVVMILPQHKSALTARTANIFSFGKDLSKYNVQ